jgi:hypothetical protein
MAMREKDAEYLSPAFRVLACVLTYAIEGHYIVAYAMLFLVMLDLIVFIINK